MTEIEKRQPYKFDEEARMRFLNHYRRTGLKYKSAKAAGVAPNTVDRYLKEDIEFQEQFQQAKGDYCDAIEAEIHRRAIEGVPVPIIGGKDRDKVVVHVQEYSDRLLEFHAKRHIPEYREKQQVDLNMTGGLIVLDQRPKSVEDWVEMADITPSPHVLGQSKPESDQ